LACAGQSDWLGFSPEDNREQLCLLCHRFVAVVQGRCGLRR
jgi:hypothetical protein